jgi:GNAT superfamily N-acetyltransferase
VGELLGVEGTRIRLRTAAGEMVVPSDQIAASRVVPPRARHKGPPHRVLGVDDLERIAADHWRALDLGRLGGWLLRAAEGFSGRANSVLPLGDPGVPPSRAVEAVQRWYAARGLPALACIATAVDDTPGTATGLPLPAASVFGAAGWQLLPGCGVRVLTAATAPIRRAARPVPPGMDLDLAPVPDQQWLARYAVARGPLPPVAERLLRNSPAQVFASVRDAGRTVAVARGSFAHGWLGVSAVTVAESHRRRGLASVLLSALAGWAARAGAASALLQVADGNTAAAELYRGHGFTVHHRYDYLRPADQEPATTGSAAACPAPR